MKIKLLRDHPKFARLTTGTILSADPAPHPASEATQMMRVRDYGVYENGALVRGESWAVADEEFEGLLERFRQRS